MPDLDNMNAATSSLNLEMNNQRGRANWLRRATVLFVTAAITSMSAAAYEKPTYAVTVHFAAGSTEVTPEMRIKLAGLLDHIKRGHWCPVEAIWTNGSADLSESSDYEARSKLAKARADIVANELRALGAPPAITFSFADGLGAGTQPWQGVVQIEAVGGSYQQPCPHSSDSNGLYLQGR